MDDEEMSTWVVEENKAMRVNHTKYKADTDAQTGEISRGRQTCMFV